MPDPSLSPFHPTLARWFEDRLGSPTAIQRLAWPAIAAGENILIEAPTGSGKTLAAFMWPIHQVLSGAWAPGLVRVLYVSPLKALNNDVRRNLIRPLGELRELFSRQGLDWPGIEVETRSGDTPSSERQRMVRHPPTFLVTTPESLNLLVCSQSGRRMLMGVQMVILDEIHAVAGGKRGTHLISAVERLVPLAGEFQRVALSATVKPVDRIASFVGGYQLVELAGALTHRPRPVRVLCTGERRPIELSIHPPSPPQASDDPEDESGFWKSLASELVPTLERNQSTLIFGNSRRQVEKMARFLDELRPGLAWSHHGSLAREIRLEVEDRLKKGELKGIVATSSLELGIDVGSVEEVVLLQTPPTIASAVQRLGRAGHQVGATSRGQLRATHGLDLVDAAVLGRLIAAGEIEEILPIAGPLDVLSQILLAMCAMEEWKVEELYQFVRCMAPFHELVRERFDGVLQLLAGRYADARIRELEPKISIDTVDNTVRARPGAVRVLYSSGGTIPDRGLYTLRRADTLSRVGELDEEFVWERSEGDTFALGMQVWRITEITHADVRVVPAGPEVPPSIIPFWRCEERNRSFHFASAVAGFLEQAERRIEDPSFARELETDYGLTQGASQAILAFLRGQRELSHAPLPHRHHVLVETCQDAGGGSGRNTAEDGALRHGMVQIVLHLPWGGKVNHPLSIALGAAWKKRFGTRIELFHGDEAILVLAPDPGSERSNLERRAEAAKSQGPGGDLIELLLSLDPRSLLREALADTGFFGAMFRENAARALLLPKPGPGRRQPLWLTRLKSKKLLDAVLRHDDFPVVIETWRSCLQDEFDLEHLEMLLEELRTGEIQVSECFTRALSPMSAGLDWRMVNKLMYEDDTPLSGAAAALRPDLFAQVLSVEALRPQVPLDTVRRFESKIQRTAPGWSPSDGRELLEHLKERVLVSRSEWEALLAAMAADGAALAVQDIALLGSRVVRMVDSSCNFDVLCAAGSVPLLKATGARRWAGPPTPFQGEALPPELISFLDRQPQPEEDDAIGAATRLLASWMRFRGPTERASLALALGWDQALVDEALDPLLQEGTLIQGRLVEGAGFEGAQQICDSAHFESLLRMARAARKPSFQPLPASELPHFLNRWQLIGEGESGTEPLEAALSRLLGLPAHAAAWEEWILPARIRGYQGAWLDSVLASSGCLWYGAGPERVAFAFPEEIALYRESSSEGELSSARQELERFLQTHRTFTFEEALRELNVGSSDLTWALWNAVWDGRCSNESFTALRRGIENRFQASALPEGSQRMRRSGFDRWRTSRPFGGSWRVIEATAGSTPDPIEEMELARERVRQLLERWGVLFKELLAHEVAPLRWSAVLRALRWMELGGEIVSGCFFEGIPGLQFASHEALRALQEHRELDEPAFVWLNATDPASLCGVISLGAEPGALSLPRRLPSNWMVYQGARLLMVARSDCRSVDIRVPPDDPRLARLLELPRALLGRAVRPHASVEIETINEHAARESPYAGPLRALGWAREHRGLGLRRKY